MERIAMMAAWNTDSGVAIHAEPLGKAWMRMGYDLRVFSFVKEDFHGKEFTGEDEDYVIRCFGTSTKTNYLDPRPILTADYDFFVVQDLGMLPKDKLARIFPVIKKRAKTVHVVHDNAPSADPSFYQHDWDAVVCFDPRQAKFLREIYPNARYIPFPCFPLRGGGKTEARRKLGLPLDRRIVIVFCRRAYLPYLPELPDPELEDVLFIILTRSDIEAMFPQTEIRKEAFFPHNRFDDYLFAADALILHKISTAPQNIGILSSTTYQCLGSGCPVLAPKISDFFHPFNEEILKYGDREELKANLLEVFHEGKKYKAAKRAAVEFVKKHSPEKIAKEFVDLFHSI